MTDATRSINDILDQSGLKLSDEERERLARIYPIIRGWVDPLRLVKVRYSEPALTYTPRDDR